MWNSLKSDFYRTLHARYFYITICLSMLVCTLIYFGIIQSNTPFSEFDHTVGTLCEFLYYLPKSNFTVLLSLILISMFVSDEYSSGYIKNVYPLQTHKWKNIVGRYLYALSIITVINLVFIFTACIAQIFRRAPVGNMDIGMYIVYLLMQIWILGAVSSFITMIIHLTKSRIIAVLFCVGYGVMFLYLIFTGICLALFNDIRILDYTMYVLSGKLPYMFNFADYKLTIFVTLGNTILYNVVSTYIFYKKDIK